MSDENIFGLIENCIESGLATFFFDPILSRKSCFIGEVVLGFEIEEEESITVFYQNRSFLLVRETEGWGVVSTALKTVAEEVDDQQSYSITRRIRQSLSRHLSDALQTA